VEAKVLKKLRSERVAWRECVARELCGRSRDLETRGALVILFWTRRGLTGSPRCLFTGTRVRVLTDGVIGPTAPRVIGDASLSDFQ